MNLKLVITDKHDKPDENQVGQKNDVEQMQNNHGFGSNIQTNQN